MHDSSWALYKIWKLDSGLGALRKIKVLNKLMTNLLEFKMRTQERLIWQHQHQRLLAVFREAYGDAYVANMPKRVLLRPYAERMAAADALPSAERAKYDKLAAALAAAR